MENRRISQFVSLLVILLLPLQWSCNGSSEESTEYPAEQINEAHFSWEAEDEAEFLTEVYSFGLMTQAYNELALSKANVPSVATDLANSLNDFTSQMNSSVEQFADNSVPNVVLPSTVGDNVIDYMENIDDEEADEFTEEYLDVVDDIFDEMEDSFDDAADDASTLALQEWAQEKLMEVEQWQDRIEEVEETADELG